MKVLLVSTNTLPAAPSGPAYVAGALRQAGHDVQVYESLFAVDLRAELAGRLHEYEPHVVGISIRLVHGDVQDAAAPFGTRYIDLRPRVREIVDIVRENSPARIVLGGPGFNYYAADWLAYLDLPYGIRGEGEEAFPLYLRALSDDGDVASIPGSVMRKGGHLYGVAPCPVQDLNGQGLPAYDLFDWAKYGERRVLPAIQTKRGCAFNCTYCPYSKLEGKHYRLKTPDRVLTEVRHALGRDLSGCLNFVEGRNLTGLGHRVMFCDNNFNSPRRHAEALCQAFLAEPLDFEWGTGDLRPMSVDDGFCRLMKDSGCFYANLSVESASDEMLYRMKRGYSARQVRESLAALSRSGIPFGASLMIGAPGETPETVAETLAVMQDHDIPLGVWVTVGVYLWTDYQEIVAEIRQSGALKASQPLFDGPIYLSPGLPAGYVEDLVSAIRSRQGYTVQVNNPAMLISH